MRRSFFYLGYSVVAEGTTHPKSLSICQLQRPILRCPGFTTLMEGMRFTGIQCSWHGLELLSRSFGCAQTDLAVHDWLRGRALPPPHSAALLSCRVQRMHRLNSIEIIMRQRLISHAWAATEDVI